MTERDPAQSHEREIARRELEQAVKGLEELPKKKRRPTRLHARAVMLPLGRLVLDDGEEAVRDDVRRLARVTEVFRQDWERAVREELDLACAEHIQGVDPRHLDHPRFDFEYVVAARERLEARLAAASVLDLSPSEATLDRIAAADRLLEPHLRRGDQRHD